MPSSDHISRQFDADLEAIRAHVLQMGGLVESQIKSAVESLVNADVALMTRVINDDHRVNAMEVKIDEACSQVIARRQPAAGDLRLVMAVIKTITDLERIGDEAEKIARMAKLLSQKQGLAIPRYHEIKRAADMVLDMLRKSLDAFARLDVVTAAQVVRQDDQVDEEFRAIMRYLITFMMEDPRTISTSLEILFVAKAIERIGEITDDRERHRGGARRQPIELCEGLARKHAERSEIGIHAVAPVLREQARDPVENRAGRSRQQHEPEHRSEHIAERKGQRALDRKAGDFARRQSVATVAAVLAEQAPRGCQLALPQRPIDFREGVAPLPKAHGRVEHRDVERQTEQRRDRVENRVDEPRQQDCRHHSRNPRQEPLLHSSGVQLALEKVRPGDERCIHGPPVDQRAPLLEEQGENEGEEGHGRNVMKVPS